jgi:hypothetical protein
MIQDESGDAGSKPAGAQNDAGGAPLDPAIARRRQDPLGRKLRAMYDGVVEQGVPDEFLAILMQADDQSSADKGGEAGGGPAAPVPKPLADELSGDAPKGDR